MTKRGLVERPDECAQEQFSRLPVRQAEAAAREVSRMGFRVVVQFALSSRAARFWRARACPE